MSIEGVPVSVLNGIGVVGLVVLFGVLLALGRIFTRGQVTSMIDDVRHDRDEWRAESRLKDAQIAEKDRQLEHMGEVGRLVKDIMHSLQRLTHDKVERQ